MTRGGQFFLLIFVRSFRLRKRGSARASSGGRDSKRRVRRNGDAGSELPSSDRETGGDRGTGRRVPPPILYTVTFRVYKVTARYGPSRRRPRDGGGQGRFRTSRQVRCRVGACRRVGGASNGVPSPAASYFFISNDGGGFRGTASRGQSARSSARYRVATREDRRWT